MRLPNPTRRSSTTNTRRSILAALTDHDAPTSEVAKVINLSTRRQDTASQPVLRPWPPSS
jgi:hypothetical protein